MKEETQALARLVAVGRGRPLVRRETADVAPRPTAAWLALATMPGEGRLWAGAARLPSGERLDLSILEPRNHAIEREGLARLGRLFAALTGPHTGEQEGDYPQLIVPDGETTRALQHLRARFRADPDPELRRLVWQIAFFLDSAKLDGADAYLDLRALLTDHVVWPLPPSRERYLGELLGCVEPDPAARAEVTARRTCVPDALADELSDLLIARSRSIHAGRPAPARAAGERRVLEALGAHADALLGLLAAGLDLWASLGLRLIDSPQIQAVTSDYRYRRSQWQADPPPFAAGRPTPGLAAHQLLSREAARQRRVYALTMADDGLFEEAVREGEAARATLIERPEPRLLQVQIAQPNLRLRHGDGVDARSLPNVRLTFLGPGDGPDRFLLRVDGGVRRASALPPGCRLELVPRWEEQLTRRRHQCLRLWRHQASRQTVHRRPRPRAADPLAWYRSRRGVE